MSTRPYFLFLTRIPHVIKQRFRGAFLMSVQAGGKYYLTIALLFVIMNSNGQVPDSGIVPYHVQEQLEIQTAGNNDLDIQNEDWLHDLQFLQKRPINLNKATENDLNHLKILTTLQIHTFLSYRALLGALLSIYELQAVPGWNVQLIERIKPYITVSTSEDGPFILSDWFKKGSGSIICSAGEGLQRSKGYQADTSTSNYYHGSPLKCLVHFKYGFKDIFQYGFTFQKDAGEQFFKGNQKAGFDFNSLHIFIKNKGIIHALALGDFAINMGQGLIQWQHGLAYKKGGEVLNIKRQDDVLRPYTSSRGVNFHRGIAITLNLRRWQVTGFVSFRKLDGTLKTDTTANGEFISAFQNSGFHRTASEVSNKGLEKQFAVGSNLSYNRNFLHLGLNIVRYNFSLPIKKGDQPYNKFALGGNTWNNCSFDYSYTFENMHIFGEVATDLHKSIASVTGMLMSLGKRADLSLLYRNISPVYQSLYGNAFTESGVPNNEKGFYIGISLLPLDQLKINSYVDLYSFPWLKYRINAPSYGHDYLLQITYKPNKEAELHTTYHYERKPLEINTGQPIDPISLQKKQTWRTHLTYQLNPTLSLRFRTEVISYQKEPNDAETGFISYVEFIIKNRSHFTFVTRLMRFETDSYNSRIYAFEENIAGASAVPVFYGKGYRYYINLNYHISKKATLLCRYASIIYPGQQSTGTGLDKVPGNTRSDLDFQTVINF